MEADARQEKLRRSLEPGGDALRRDEYRACQHRGDECAEDEAADVCEERDAAPVRTSAEDSEVGLEELVQEPEAQEEPGRELHREDGQETTHGRVRLEHEVGAQYGRDRAAGAAVPDAAARSRSE